MQQRVIKIYKNPENNADVIGFSRNCLEAYADPALAAYFWKRGADYTPFMSLPTVYADGTIRYASTRDKLPPENGFSHSYAGINPGFTEDNIDEFAVFCANSLFPPNESEVFVYDNRDIIETGNHVGKLIRRSW